MCGFLAEFKSEYSTSTLQEQANLIQHRGPDQSTLLKTQHGRFIFHRLAIVDQSEHGQQPFRNQDIFVVCNGEIYNDPELRPQYEKQHYAFQSLSDCEILLPLYQEHGAKGMMSRLDGEFAFVVYDTVADSIFAGRDPMGIRPLFYGYSAQGGLLFASEAKALHALCVEILPFPPGALLSVNLQDLHSLKWDALWQLGESSLFHGESFEEVKTGIRTRLIEGVRKRLRSDAPIGFLLSGGLDSSLVCSIASRLMDQPITTFSIGIVEDSIDTHYARQVAEYLGTIHHEYLFTRQEMMDHLSDLIFQLETWDITTIRASIGMSLLCRYIREKTEIKVVLTGEVSDEIFGYKYTDFAPTPQAFQDEAAKRVDELYLYDVLRADRCISLHGLEARVPFSDTDFVAYVMGIDPHMKMNHYQMGKYLLRAAFEDDGFLPESILYRQKAAFSDAVGHSMVDELKAYADGYYSQDEFEHKKTQYAHGTPFTKESLLYREIFESHFPGRSALIPEFWMPNRKWQGCDVQDPSARALSNYGASGSVLLSKKSKLKVYPA
jgi:asparagine synthase (glutamine-hydrolysing)